MAVRPAKPKPKARVRGYANRITPAQRMALPVDSELLWTGTRQPNPNFRPEGFGNLTPIQVGGQWQVYGTRTDPVGAAAQPVLDRINTEKERAQRWATEQVAPWASAAFGNLATLNTATQTGFANALGRGMTNIGNLAGSTAPPGYAGTEGLAAPRAVDTAAGNTAAVANSQAAADMGGINAAVSSLGTGATAQSQLGALSAQIASIPRGYDERVTRFMESLVPVRLQLEQSRSERQAARSQWQAEFGEGRRRFDQQMQQEAQLTGLKLDQDQQQFNAELAQDQAEFDTKLAVDQSERTSYTEKEARSAGGRGFWNRKPRKAPKGTSLVQAADTGRWVAIPANRSAGGTGGSGGQTAAQKRYAKIRDDWAKNAYGYLNTTTTTTDDGYGGVTKREVPARFQNPIAFFRSATAAGVNAPDAYEIMLANVPASTKIDQDAITMEVYRAIQRRNPRLNSSQINSRVRQITGRYARVGNLGP